MFMLSDLVYGIVSFDIFLFSVIAVAAIVLGLIKKSFLLSVTISFYPTILIYLTLSGTNIVDSATGQIITFLVIFLASLYLINTIFSDYYADIDSSLFDAIFLGLSFALLIFISISVFVDLESFSPVFQFLLDTKYKFYHYVVPLIFVFLATR